MWDAKTQRPVYDGRRMRNPIQRKSVDPSATVVRLLEVRAYQRGATGRGERALHALTRCRLAQHRPYERDARDFVFMQPHSSYKRYVSAAAARGGWGWAPCAQPARVRAAQMLPSFAPIDNVADGFTTRFCHTSVNKERFPIFCAAVRAAWRGLRGVARRHR